MNKWWFGLLLLFLPASGTAQIRAPQGWWQQEDQRLRTSIEVLPYGIEEVLRMQPWRFDEKLPDGGRARSVGLMAQELEKIIPEAVRPPSKTCDYWAIDYSRLVPVLIAALQQQQRQLAELRQQVAELLQQHRRPSNGQEYVEPSPGIYTRDEWLGQSIPNPHDGTTVIPYYVPREVGSAVLVVRDGAGRQVVEYVLGERGMAGQVVVRMSEHASGVYEYGLVLDGRVVATKQMQLVR